MNILHLSDIHFGRNNPAYGISGSFNDHDKILDDLIAILERDNPTLQIEHIVVTGDIAWHGKKEEFEEASVFFKKLLKALGLTGRDISFCVGNHDVDISYCSIWPDLDVESAEQVDNLYQYKNVEKLRAVTFAYDQFCEEMGMEPYIYPDGNRLYNSYSVGFKDIVSLNGEIHRLVSLNTSLVLAVSDNPDAYMWLGQPQIQTLIETGILTNNEKVINTIVLTHHAEHYLNRKEIFSYDGRVATYGLLVSNSDLVLSGHSESSSQPRLINLAGGGKVLSAGSTYYDDEYKNSFSVLILTDKKRKLGVLSYIHEATGWIDWDNSKGPVPIPKVKFPKSRDFYHLTLRLEDARHGMNIKLASVDLVTSEDGQIDFDNHHDYMNFFYVEHKAGHFCIKVPDRWRFCPEAIRQYEKYASFMDVCDPKSVRWSLIKSDGTKMCEGQGAPEMLPLEYDEEIIRKLNLVSANTGARFITDICPNKEDLIRLDIMCELLSNGYVVLPVIKDSITSSYGKDELMSFMIAASQNNDFYIKKEVTKKVTLLGVTINAVKWIYYAGPYHIDIADLSLKIETFMEGDKRSCTFSGDKILPYVIYKVDVFEADHKKLCLEDHVVR